MKEFFEDFFVFIKKQASSAVFGGLMLFFIIATQYFHIEGLNRYDLLFIIAILIQVIMISFKFEHPREVFAIIIFHFFAMLMEVFKTSPTIGSWAYPGTSVLSIYSVPLFSGFMYSAVGSYIARSWRINDFSFSNLPSKPILISLALIIYINFFTNHFTYDIRYIIFFLLIVTFWKSKLFVTLTRKRYQIHPLVANALFALFVWLAEQIGTFARVWIYPNQAIKWTPVSFHMYTSWYMLLVFSFIIIALLQSRKLVEKNI